MKKLNTVTFAIRKLSTLHVLRPLSLGTLACACAGFSTVAMAESSVLTYWDTEAEIISGYLHGVNELAGTSTLPSGKRAPEKSHDDLSGFTVQGKTISDEDCCGTTLVMDGGKVLWLIGGEALGYDRKAVSNTVTLKGTASVTKLEGGRGTGNAEGNEVLISEEATIEENGTVDAGYSTGAGAKENKIIINATPASGTFTIGKKAVVTAGHSMEGEVSDNSLTISGSTTIGSGASFYAGWSQGLASGNTITVTANTVTANPTFGSQSSLYGGYSFYQALNNTVTIDDGTFAEGSKVRGGFAQNNEENATASGNTVTINDITLSGQISGGYVEVAKEAEAGGNKVLVGGGEINGIICGGYALGTTSSVAVGNVVTVKGGTINKLSATGSVYGGEATGVTVSANATAKENTIIIKGGTVNVEVYGGVATSDSAESTANENTVIIDGATVNASIYAGTASSSTGNQTASKNTLKLLSGQLGSMVELYGGHLDGNAQGTRTSTENTLEVHKPFSAQAVYDFQEYAFYIPQINDTHKHTTTMLTLTNSMALDQAERIKVKELSGYWKKNDFVYLISQVNTSITDAFKPDTIALYSDHSVGMGYEYSLNFDNNKVKMTIDNVNRYGIKEGDIGYRGAVNENTTLSGYETTVDEVSLKEDKTQEQFNIVYGAYVSTKEAGVDVAANANKVTIEGGEIKGGAYVGYASAVSNATANNNELIIKGGDFSANPIDIGDAIYGGYAKARDYAEASNNVITIESEASGYSNVVMGGYVRANVEGRACNNRVRLIGGALQDLTLFGGYVNSGGGTKISSGNTLEVHNTFSIRSVERFQAYEFYIPTNTASETVMLTTANSVNLADCLVKVFSEDGTALTFAQAETLYGKDITLMSKVSGSPTVTKAFLWDETKDYTYLVFANTSDNTLKLTVQKDAISGDGVGYKENVTQDTVIENIAWTFKEGQTANSVYAVQILSQTPNVNVTANNNTITIDGGTVNNTIYGAYAKTDAGKATAKANRVRLISGTVKPSVDLFGGHVEGTSVETSGNTLEVHNSFAVNSVNDFQKYEFYIPKSVGAGETMLSVAKTVELNSAEVSIESNEASLTSGEAITLISNVSGSIKDNALHWESSHGGELSYGTLCVQDASLRMTCEKSELYGTQGEGQSLIVGYEAKAMTDTAMTGFKSSVASGKTYDNVYGAYVSSADNFKASAQGNTVIVEAGTVKGEICGGYAKSNAGEALANDNTVVLKGGNLVNAALYGGRAFKDTVEQITHGNTLEVWSQGIRVKSVQNFSDYLFVVPQTAIMSEGAITSVAPMLSTQSAVVMKDAKVAVAFANSITLAENDKAVLVDKVESVDGMTLIKPSELKQGVKGGKVNDFLGGDLALSVDENKALVVTVTNIRAGETSKAVAESSSSAAALLCEGADLIAGDGMTSAGRAAKGAANAGSIAPAGFGAASGGYSRYKTGSHVNMKSFGLVAGVAKNVNVVQGAETMVGAFFETGFGDYDTHNGDFRGDGKSHYYGVGLFTKMRFGTEQIGPYVEASARLGYSDNEWEAGAIEGFKYDKISGMYGGAHIGLGYEGPINKAWTVDAYAKLFWTRQQGDELKVKDAQFKFYDVDSIKTRLGARIKNTAIEGLTPYIGFAWDHEYDAKAKSSVNAMPVQAPSLKGNTGVMEVGFKYTPSAKSVWSIEFKASAYCGKRRGADGQILFRTEL